MTGAHPAPGRRLVGPAALWFGLFGAAVAWTVQELVSFALVSHSCYPDWQPRTEPTVAGTWTIVLVVGLAMLGLGVAATAAAWNGRRRTEPPDSHGVAQPRRARERRVRFMATSGLVVSGMMLFTIVLNLVALFIVPPCG